MKKERWGILSSNSDFLVWEPSRSDRKLIISRIGVRHTEGGDNPIPFEYAIWSKEEGGWDRQLFPDHVKTLKEKKIYALTIWRLEE